jgi:hypothetical protein
MSFITVLTVPPSYLFWPQTPRLALPGGHLRTSLLPNGGWAVEEVEEFGSSYNIVAYEKSAFDGERVFFDNDDRNQGRKLGITVPPEGMMTRVGAAWRPRRYVAVLLT